LSVAQSVQSTQLHSRQEKRMAACLGGHDSHTAVAQTQHKQTHTAQPPEVYDPLLRDAAPQRHNLQRHAVLIHIHLAAILELDLL
jgi:hypothetical protein